MRIVDAKESAHLNNRWRARHSPTNVLSFPSGLAGSEHVTEPVPLGDIVLCAPIIAQEACEQGKSLLAHWAHMAVHGILHLLGHDHIEAHATKCMERLETRILRRFNFPAPY